MNNYKRFEFRSLFVSFEGLEAHYTDVFLDGHFIDCIPCRAKDQEAFDKECDSYLMSDRYEQKADNLRKQFR